MLGAPLNKRQQKEERMSGITRKGKHCFSLLAMLIGVLLSIAPVFGEEATSETAAPETAPATSGLETDAERDKVYMKIGTVTVTEKSDYLTTADLPTSVDVLGADQIEDQNVDFSMELFRKLPGTYYGNWNQGIIAGTFGIRGFDHNHDTPVALHVDGIPSNWAYGRLDMQPYFPMEIERIELVKGTNDPRYGLNNIAGNANVFTKWGGNYSQAKFLYGSFDTNEGDILLAQEEDGFSQTYFVGYRRTDGYRDHSESDKGSMSGKWFYTTNDNRLTIGAIARFFDLNADSPGYLTREQAEADPTQAQSFSGTDGGDQRNRHISLHADYEFTDNLYWSFNTYAQHLDRTRWCRFSEAGSQQERVQDEDQQGAISTLTYETADWGINNVSLAWGLDYQYQDNIYQRYRTDDRVRRAGGPYRDWAFTNWYWGTYVEADAEFTDWLRLVAGLRMDRLDGEFEDKVNGVKADMINYGNIWQPKIGTVITPVQGYNLYANWGRTFQVGADNMRYGVDYNGDLLNRDIDYSENDGWEVGIKVSPMDWLVARISCWEQKAKDEVRLKGDGSGDYDNYGKTKRDGWDFVLSVRPHDWVTLWGSYTIQNAEYTEPGYDNPERKGKDIEEIPDYTSKTGIDFEHPIGISSCLWWESQGDYYVDPTNTEPKEGDYDIVNMNLRYKLKNVTYGLEVLNLFDEDYHGFVWHSSSSGTWFSPGSERSYYVTITLDF